MDLRGTQLAGANLKDADLRGVDFTYAAIFSANLKGANLTDTIGLKNRFFFR